MKRQEERNAVRQMAGSSTSKGKWRHSLGSHLYEKTAKYWSVNVWNVYDGDLILKAGANLTISNFLVVFWISAPSLEDAAGRLFAASFTIHQPTLCDETKILTDTKTETFYPRQIFPIPIPRLFFRDQIFRDRYRDFFSETKFSDTDTETFFPRQNFSRPIPRLSFRDQIFRYRYRDYPKNCHGSRDWDRDRDFCIWLTNFRHV